MYTHTTAIWPICYAWAARPGISQPVVTPCPAMNLGIQHGSPITSLIHTETNRATHIAEILKTFDIHSVFYPEFPKEDFITTCLSGKLERQFMLGLCHNRRKSFATFLAFVFLQNLICMRSNIYFRQAFQESVRYFTPT